MNSSMIVLGTVLLASTGWAQTPENLPLKTMRWQERSEAVLHENHKLSALAVWCPIPGLRIESDKGVLSQVETSLGNYEISLNPGPNVLRAVAPGYDTLVIGQLRFKAGGGKALSIFEVADNHGYARIQLLCADTTCSDIEAEINGKRQRVPRGRGVLYFHPPAGLHALTLRCQNLIWTARFNLLSGTEERDTVRFLPDTAAVPTAATDAGFGSLTVVSIPDSGAVYLNGFLMGYSPLTMKAVRPGDHTVRVEKDLYVAEPRTVIVTQDASARCEVPLTLNSGKINIESQPSGAQVTIRNLDSQVEQIVGTTPVHCRVNAGRYLVRLLRPCYEPLSDTLVIHAGTERSPDPYALVPQFARVHVSSYPAGADIMVDDTYWGKTDTTHDTVALGMHVIRLSLKNYLSEERAFLVNDTSAVAQHFLLRFNAGWLSIQSDPDSAEVTWEAEGRLFGVTPLKDILLEPGSYNLRLRKPLYVPKVVSATIVASEHLPLMRVELERARGHLEVRTVPPGTSVMLDGKPVGISPISTDTVLSGAHTLHFEARKWDAIDRNIWVSDSGPTVVIDTLRNDQYRSWTQRRWVSRIVAVVVPGGGQFVSRQYLRGLVYFAGVGVSFHLAEHAAQSRQNADSRYGHFLAMASSATSSADSLTYRDYADAAKSSSRDSRRKTQLFTALCITGYVVQAADAVLFGGGKRSLAHRDRLPRTLTDRIQLRAAPSQISLVVRF